SRGIAAGVFAGCFPFLGFQTIIGLILATIIKGNRIAAVASTWISNPLTYVPIFAFNFQIGHLLLGGEDFVTNEIQWSSWDNLMELGLFFMLTLILGSFCVGLITSIGSYIVSSWAIGNIRKSKGTKRNS
ncbi:MAG: DUF2062 domain-containing protein, partial [Okeania sp. SIO2D1]|nr:DUF2062 domain-containing protein [Okeania sp. SIO2D1]